MKRVLPTLVLVAIAGLGAACGDNVVSGACDDFAKTSVEAGSFPNEASAAKAKEHLAKAKESIDKNDEEGCKTHVKAAKEALKF